MPDFTQKHLPQSEIVDWMAGELYPREGDSIRKKRVRARINDARKRVVNNQKKRGLAKATKTLVSGPNKPITRLLINII